MFTVPAGPMTSRHGEGSARHLRAAGVALLLVGLGVGATSAALAGSGHPSSRAGVAGWRLTVRVVGYNSTNPGVTDASLPVGHVGTDYVALTATGTDRDLLAVLPSGRHGFVSSDGLVGPTRRHVLVKRHGTWSDTFPWPTGGTATSCAGPKVVLALTVHATSLHGTEQVPLSYNCYGTETWYTQTVSLKISGVRVSTIGTGSAVEQPAAGGAFTLARLSYPTSVVANGAPGNLRVFWRGHPDFPLRLTETSISCPAGFRCGSESTEVTLRENPQVFVDALDCSGFVSAAERFRYRITLHDAAGRSTRSAVESFTCTP